MIVEPDFIARLLHIFEDPEIGMVGMVGTPHLPENKIPWWAWRVGALYTCNVSAMGMFDYEYPEEAKNGVIEVEAIDGLLMATQYDIPWRDDLFDKWDFYDVSQSLEFIRHGYKVVVPYMETPWCIHDDGFMNLKNYYEEREKLLKEYGTM
jgi:hypothetical protein